MPAAYSYDLRTRAMTHLEAHGSATFTSEVFGISRSILYHWKKRKALTGDILPKSGYQKGYGHKVGNLEELRQVIERSPGLTLKGIIKEIGISMSVMTCCRALKRLNFTQKKRLIITKNRTQTNEGSF